LNIVESFENLADMAITVGRGLSDAGTGGDPHRGEQDDERSIGEALRITLLFVAVVILLLWAGVAETTNSAGPGRPAASSRP
jgi:hypothetical protein